MMKSRDLISVAYRLPKGWSFVCGVWIAYRHGEENLRTGLGASPETAVRDLLKEEEGEQYKT